MSGISRGMTVATIATVAVLLAVAAGAGMAVAQEQTDDDTTTTVYNGTQGPYSINELRDAGQRGSANAPASIRRYGSGQLWLRYAPSGIGGSAGNPATYQYLEHGTTIERGEVYLGGFLGWDQTTELDVTVVYWDEGTQPVYQNGEQVDREPVAENQEVMETTVSLSPYEEASVDLLPNYDGERRATMFVSGPGGQAQWAFNVHTSRTAEPISYDTRGQLALYLSGFLLLTTVLTVGLMYGARQWHKRAGAGPQYPLWLYGAAAFPIGFMSLVFGYRRILNTVAEAPWILIPIVAVAATMAAISWWGDDTRRVGLIDIDLSNPEIHKDGSGGFDIDIRSFDLAEVDGKEGVVLPGISNYLARTRGTIPVVDKGDADPSVKFNGTGIFDEIYFMDPYDDDPVTFEREGWSLEHLYQPTPADEIPDNEGFVDSIARFMGAFAWPEIVAAVVIILAGYLLGSVLVASGLVGAAVASVAAFMYAARPVQGRCEWNLAPGQFGSVVVEMIKAGETFDELADKEWFEEQYYSERAKNVAAHRQAQEEDEMTRFEKVMAELENDAQTPRGEPADD